MDRIVRFPFIPTRWQARWNVPFIMMGLVLVLLLPWAWHEGAIKALNHDIFWLLTGLERVLSGQAMVDAVYETNPPLSFFIYLPVYLLSGVGVPVEIALLVTVFAGVSLSAVAIYHLLSRYFDVDQAFICGVCGVYVVGATSLIVPEFGQRDHLLALGLVPFLLAQFALLDSKPPHRAGLLIWCVCFAGAFLILLKPHYAIIPASMIFVRFMRGRGFAVLRDPDVAALGVMVVLYAAVLGLFFRDYVTQIVPAVVELYDAFGGNISQNILIIFTVLNAIVLLASYGMAQAQMRRMVFIFVLGSVAALIPYVLMQKGFFYHLVPSSLFFFMALGVLCQQMLRQYARPGFAMAATILFAAVGAMLLPHSYYPTRNDVMMMPVTQALAWEPGTAKTATSKKCDGECRFMILGMNLRTTQLSSHYAGGEQGSRFGTLWFAPGLMQEDALLRHSNNPEEKADYLKQKAAFTTMLKKDIVNWRPDRLLFCDSIGELAYFGEDTILKGSPYDYRMVKTLSVNRSAFFSATDKKMDQCKLYDRIDP